MLQDYEEYPDFSIVETASICGVPMDPRTLKRVEVLATCPFCGDHGAGKYHLSLNTVKNQYRCNLCNSSGNSISMYSKLKTVSNEAAFQSLSQATNSNLVCAKAEPEPEPVPLEIRHDVFYDLLQLLPLYARHRQDLQSRGLSSERIELNCYRSLPADWRDRCSIANKLAGLHDLRGVPGFFTQKDGQWNFCGKNGFLIPYLSVDGLIQGMQIRVNEEELEKNKKGKLENKYRWFSSRGLPNGTRNGSYIHVTGNLSNKEAYLTEGGLKGDISSYLSDESLFVCVAGMNNIQPELRDVLLALKAEECIEAVDMDKRDNFDVRRGLARIRFILCSMNIRHSVCSWNPELNGIDNFLLSEIQKSRQSAA